MFRYLESYKELIKQINLIHTWHNSPTIIFITQIEKYFIMNDTIGAEKLNRFIAASLLDAALSCASKNNKKTVLILTSSPYTNNINNLKSVIQLYIQDILFIHDRDSKNNVFSILNNLLE